MRGQAAVTTYVVGDRLPWPDEDGARFGQPAFERGVLIAKSGASDCAIRKISQLGATIDGDPLGEAGDTVAIELPNGQRCSGKLEWSRGREAGLQFDEPLDIVALINRNLVAQPAERRTMPRIELRVPANLKWAEHLEPALTRNISARGMQVEGDYLPAIGTYLAIYLDGLALPPCEVVWRQNKLAGVEFFEELSWASIIPWVKGISRAAAG